MSQPSETTVVYAYLRGQIQACHEAIRDICAAAQIGGELTPELSQAIDFAVKQCLPDDARAPEMTLAVAQEKGEFDDVLG